MPKITTDFSTALQWVHLAINNEKYDIAKDMLTDLINQSHTLEKLDMAERNIKEGE